MKNLLTIFFIFMLINAQGQIVDNNGWKTYYDKDFLFSLQYPPDWEFHNDMKEVKCMIYAPVYKEAKYRANISAEAFALPPSNATPTVKDFAEVSFGQFRKLMKDCRVMVTKDISQDGISKYLVVANGIVDGKYVYVKQVYCLNNNIAYIINYIGEAGIKDPFAIAAGDILASFKPDKSIDM